MGNSRSQALPTLIRYARTRLRLPRRRVPHDELPVCVVYGNCQADAIRTLLDRSPAFRMRFRTLRIPGVHKITTDTVDLVRMAVSSASLIVSHPVRDGYHGYPVGSEEILTYASPDCRRVTVPALYYDGLFPFQVYVRD